MIQSLQIPFPDPKIWPNRTRGVHWANVHKLTKAYKANAMQCCMEWHISRRTPLPIHVKYEGIPPTKRARDLDNFEAALKSARDGITEYMGHDDDNTWTTEPSLIDETQSPGVVNITIFSGEDAIREKERLGK